MHTMGHSNFQTFQRFYRNKKVSKDVALSISNWSHRLELTGDLSITSGMLYQLSYDGNLLDRKRNVLDLSNYRAKDSEKIRKILLI